MAYPHSRRRWGIVALLASVLLLGCSASASSSKAPVETSPPAAMSSPFVELPASVPPATALEPQGPLAGRSICIDPGHDAVLTPGATARTRAGTTPRHPADGIVMTEHELTLSVATRLQALLEADGARVCLTCKMRDLGGGLQNEPYDFTGDGKVRPIDDVPEIIQPRIDWSNDFGAEVLLSIHFNGSDDARVRGTEVYYTDAGPRADDGRQLAQTMLSKLLATLGSAGLQTTDRGVKSDKYQRYSTAETAALIGHYAATIRTNGYDPANCGDCMRLMTLGNNPMSLHRGNYLAALVEVEFLSNPDVVEGFLMRPDSLDIIAEGLHDGLLAYFIHE